MKKPIVPSREANQSELICGRQASNYFLTKRSRAIEIMREVANHLRIMADHAPVLIWISGPDTLCIYFNKVWLDFTGRTLEQELGNGWTEAVHPEDLQRCLDIYVGHFEQRLGISMEYRLRGADGQYRWVMDQGVPRFDAKGAFQGYVGSCIDITERKQAERLLRESEESYRRQFTDNMSVMLMIDKNDGRIVEANTAAETFYGYSRELLLDLHIFDINLLPPGSVQAAMDSFEFSQSALFMFQHRLADGSIRDVEVSTTKTHLGQQQILLSIVHDITERKRAQGDLQKIRTAIEQSPVSIVITDLQGTIEYVNPMFTTITGYSFAEAKGQNPRILKSDDQPPVVYKVLWDTILSGKTWRGEFQNKKKNGELYWERASISPVRNDQGVITSFVAVKEDISAQKQAKEEKLKLLAQLQQSQKMESLGVLAGGVAHDMNNVLGAILGLASAHIGTQPYGSPLHRALDTICKATERGGKMVKTLLSFARQSPVENRELDMNTILREQVDLLERTTLAKVCIHMDLEPNLHPIQGDASSLTNAIMNLCVNAADAMPENGSLTLHSRNVDYDWIEVVVKDTGTGMPKWVLEKALDPFFTTKGVGKGTGLGLSMVFSTVKAHRGQMDIQSEPDQGTRVQLRFPASKKEAQDQIADPADPEAMMISHRLLQVMLIDDDELIQNSVQMILEVLGHTVNTAQSGEEALAMLEAGVEPDLFILDMNMPGLGGVGTLPRLRGLRPTVPVLLSTGRADQTALDLASAHPGVTLLSKPFGVRELQKQLENVGLG